MGNRPELTDKQGRALCLAYRNGHRCARLARVHMSPAPGTGGKYHVRIVCQECADRQEAEGATVLETCARGFAVRVVGFWPGITREYTAITG